MAEPPRNRQRCAVYTRKSSEEGLEQAFNSLHAQREACEAYVLSQRHEGWTLIKTSYDDGGFSGGSMDRPGLDQLLVDVRAGLVDIIVVYKIDRLTRSLADFARIVETLDAKGASFVSVTQAFNTTTSMGRLTLNVLLSFAQFEREVTGERIRDKIAASKAKGMWMGGQRPLGYAIENRGLVPHPVEAAIIAGLFERFLAVGSVDLLRDEVIADGSIDQLERRTSTPISRGALYHLLQNPLYVGVVCHKEKRYPGLHLPIVDRAVFEQVQAGLAGRRAVRAQGERSATPALLTGLLFDTSGLSYTPTHTARRGRRYRYYCVQDRGAAPVIRRLPGEPLEDAVYQGLATALSSPAVVAPLLATAAARDLSAALSRAQSHSQTLTGSTTVAGRTLFRALVARAVVGDAGVTLSLRLGRLVDGASPADQIHINLPLKLARRGGELKLIVGADGQPAPHPDHRLVSLVAKATHWLDELKRGEVQSQQAIADREAVSPAYVGQVLELAFLAPDLKAAILEGRQPAMLTGARLKKLCPLPLEWAEQRKLFRWIDADC